MGLNNKEKAQIAVLGGSGLYEMKSISEVTEIKISTPFGNPSDAIILGTLSGIRCAFLPRHGRGHSILPSEINGRANIYALKSLGVERILAVGAVGSLKEELAPRHFVFPDQIVDKTKGRPSTFFGNGIVAHISFAHPFCSDLSRLLHDTASSLGIPSHLGGTYVCMEGPAFSTKAESEYHRRMQYSLIGMTALPEAKLAREAEICYALAALVTDYDCWKEGEEVSTDKIVGNLLANVAQAQAMIEKAIPKIARTPRECSCAQALKGAVFTQPEAMDPETLKNLEILIGRYVAV